MTKIPDANSPFPPPYQWMEKLPDETKRTIMAALQKSLEMEKGTEQESTKKASDFAGIWEGDETAEELIKMIEGARYRNQ